MGAREPALSTIRAENGESSSPTSIIGMKTRPVSSGVRVRTCWKYRLNRNGMP